MNNDTNTSSMLNSFGDNHSSHEVAVETLVNRRTVYDNTTKERSGAPAENTIRLCPFLSTSSSTFSTSKSPLTRVVRGDGMIRVGRMSMSPTDIVFSEKVVSRSHAEFHVKKGNWYVMDVGSSSGTFVNNVRLSECGRRSDLRKIEPGDVIRFGVDFRGGQEPVYRAVHVRVELNGQRIKDLSGFQKKQLDVIKKLQKRDDAQTVDETCAICLQSYNTQLALFMSPCGHMWHYTCVKNSIDEKYPFFECFICRKSFNLDQQWSDDDNDDDFTN